LSGPRETLLALWDAALAAVDPAAALRPHLPDVPGGRIVIVGAGKAAAPMALEAARRYGPRARGAVVTRRGYGLRAGEDAGAIEVLEAAHPIPDAAALKAGAVMLRAVEGLGPEDHVLCLLSGGGSALLEAPAPGVSFAEIRALNAALLASGAAISEINCVRKHVSAIKGGRLAAAAWPARVTTFAVSDVPGDDPSTIASGPTVPDPTSRADALAVVARYGIALPASMRQVLDDDAGESPKPGDARLAMADYRIVASQAQALAAAEALGRRLGFEIVDLGTRVEGEAGAVGAEHARRAIELAAAGRPTVVLSGGELTVTLGGPGGSGGPNREYALAFALAAQRHPHIWALAADTDGVDGSDDGAGAIVTPDTLARAGASGLDADASLAAHDSGAFFARLGDAIACGPTRTNVSDFRAALITA
jgi:hydroxypyruvate reductase